jgi:hypothetical protein
VPHGPLAYLNCGSGANCAAAVPGDVVYANGVSTSIVERSNLTIRTHCRRLTRLSLGFSKKLENSKASMDLYFCFYNFVRMHRTIRATPAMEAGGRSSRDSTPDEALCLSVTGLRCGTSIRRQVIDQFIQTFRVRVEMGDDGAQFSQYLARVASLGARARQPLQEQQYSRALLTEFAQLPLNEVRLLCVNRLRRSSLHFSSPSRLRARLMESRNALISASQCRIRASSGRGRARSTRIFVPCS